MSFLLHLFHEVVVIVVVDPTSSTEPPCTLPLPKRAPLLSSPPPPTASLLKQTLWTACMTFQLCGWHSLLQRLQQYTGLLKHNSRGTSIHDPSSDSPLRSSAVSSPSPLILTCENLMRNVDVFVGALKFIEQEV